MNLETLNQVKDRTTSQQFGALLRKHLLTGSQWVVTMAQRLLDQKGAEGGVSSEHRYAS